MEVAAISINFRKREINQLSKKRNENAHQWCTIHAHKKVVVLGAFNLSRFMPKKNIEFVLHNFAFNAVTFIRCASFQFVVVCQSFRFVFVIITFLQCFFFTLVHIDSRVSCILHSFV